MNRLKESVKLALVDHETINTQTQLAEVLGMSGANLSRMLNNPTRLIGEHNRQIMGTFLGMSPQALSSILLSDYQDAKDREDLFEQKPNVDFSKIVQLEARMQNLAEQNKLLQEQFKQLAGIGDALKKAAKMIAEQTGVNAAQASLIAAQAKELADFKNNASGDGSATQ